MNIGWGHALVPDELWTMVLTYFSSPLGWYEGEKEVELASLAPLFPIKVVV